MAEEEALDVKLSRVIFQPDPEPHIVLDEERCRACGIGRVCLTVCPAGNYSHDPESDRVTVSCESCLECGACRIVCSEEAIRWRWPRGGQGVCYIRS